MLQDQKYKEIIREDDRLEPTQPPKPLPPPKQTALSQARIVRPHSFSLNNPSRSS